MKNKILILVSVFILSCNALNDTDSEAIKFVLNIKTDLRKNKSLDWAFCTGKYNEKNYKLYSSGFSGDLINAYVDKGELIMFFRRDSGVEKEILKISVSDGRMKIDEK